MNLIRRPAEAQIEDDLSRLVQGAADRTFNSNDADTPRIEVAQLPDPVVKYLDSIAERFNVTSSKLRDRADALRKVADDLEKRANRIDSMAPQMQESMTDWIRYERECLERATRLSLINPNGG